MDHASMSSVDEDTDAAQRIGWPDTWLEAAIVSKLGDHLKAQGLDFYTPDDIRPLLPALAPRFAAASRQLARLGRPVPEYVQAPFHVWHGHGAWAPAANSEAVMSMFAYMAMSDADHAALAAASPASPMRGARPLVMRRVVNAVLDRLGAQPGGVSRGVELGCGSGRLCWLAAGMLPNAEIIGVDASPYMVAWASAPELAAPEEAVDPSRVSFRVGLAEDTGIEAGSCDFVMVPFVAHELPHAARLAFLSEARRLLRPGGVVAFVDHRQDGLEHTIFHKLKGRAPLLGDAFHALLNVGAPEPYIREYHEHPMQDSYREAGFEGGGPEGFVPVTRWQHAMLATKPRA